MGRDAAVRACVDPNGSFDWLPDGEKLLAHAHTYRETAGDMHYCRAYSYNGLGDFSVLQVKVSRFQAYTAEADGGEGLQSTAPVSYWCLKGVWCRGSL